MLDTTKMTVDEIRSLLIAEYGCDSVEVANIKGKSALVTKLAEFQTHVDEADEDNELLNTAEVVVDGAILDDNSEMEAPIPTFHDKNWTEYVLSQLYEDELDNGKPKVDGLRRISEILLGQIYAVESEVLQCPSPENQFHATVKVRIVCNDRIVDGSADVGPNNTQHPFSAHAVATAESRAESRAYRRLLRLRNVLTAEEAVDLNDIHDPYDRINDTQIHAIRTFTKKSQINLEKWLATHDITLDGLDRVSKSKAVKLCEELSGYQSTVAIPKNILETNNEG